MLQEAPTAADALGERPVARAAEDPGRRIWIVFADPMANRIFFECGIVDRLQDRFPDRLQAAFVLHPKHLRVWKSRLEGIPVLDRDELMPPDVALRERAARRVDAWLDHRVGFYPLAIRHSRRHGFFRGRMAPGHPVPFLDSDRAGPLPRWGVVESAMARWHHSRRRHVPSALLERLRAECEGLVVTSAQAEASTPVLTAARRLRVPVVGYIASWDHQVGKGIISPYLDRYLVQNEIMRADLLRYHGIEPERVVVTGWPQTDVYHRRRQVGEYEALLRTVGVQPGRAVVLYAGNSPNNSPYEQNLVSRLVDWWRASPARERVALLFRPHPYDNEVERRYAAALGAPGISVQHGGDYGDLVTLLQHVDCVVAGGGTILLEALVNDRPSVCAMFAEGAPPGFDAVERANLTGEHYRQLIESEAFYRARGFDELVAMIERALANPTELHDERRRVAREVVGEIDGRAAERVVAAIDETLARKASLAYT